MRLFSSPKWAFLFIFFIASMVIVSQPSTKEKTKKLTADEITVVLKGYLQFTQQLDQRSTDDRQALYQFISDLDKIFKKNKEIPFSEKCPCLDPASLKSKREFFESLAPFENQFQSLIQNGVILQHPMKPNPDIPNFLNVRMFVYWTLALAVVDFDKGDHKKAIERINSIIELEKGFSDTPQLLYVMIGSSFGQMIDKTVLHLLPLLSEEEIKKLGALLSNLPDIRMQVINALKAEVISIVYKNQPALINALVKNYTQKSTLTLNSKLEKPLPAIIQEIAMLEDWVNHGGQGDVPVFQSEAKKANFWLNASSLMYTADKFYDHRKNIVAAMEAEMGRRGSEDKKDVVLPYDDKNTIRLTSKYGCIEKTK